MAKFFRDIYSVLWSDLRILRHQWTHFLVSSLMTPVLYLLAFGFGLGQNASVMGTGYLQFVLPGIVALTSMNASYNEAGMKLNIDRLFYKCFDEILMAPVGPVSLVLGKALVGVVRGLFVSAAFVVIGVVAGGMRVNGLFVMTLVLSCCSFSFLGVLAALVARSHMGMATFSSVVLTPMTFLGGTFFAVDQAPAWLRAVLELLPLVHVSRCLRSQALGLSFPWPSFGVMVAFTALFLVAALVALRRTSA